MGTGFRTLRPVGYPPSGSNMPRSAHRFWQRLMPALEERRVIPVIGQDLVTHEQTEPSLPLYTWVARRIAQQLGGKPDSSAASLNDVACQHLERGGSLDDVYFLAKEHLVSRSLPIPDSLQKLGQIAAFRLYLTLTPDPLLERAINTARRADGSAQALSYRLGHDFDDLPDYVDRLAGPVVYHLFGRASAIRGSSAITDEDLVEFMHQLQTPERRPRRVFDALEESHVLLIGTGFPDWLMRFFLRTVHRERLWLAPGGFVADLEAVRDVELRQFLRQYTREMLYDGGAREFVAELWARWQERHQDGGSPAPLEVPAPRHAVFLSYATEDRALVEALHQELDREGIESWYDRSETCSGARWEEMLLAGIEQCAVFVPLLSQHALDSWGRDFRVEWQMALDRVARMPKAANGGESEFVLPIVVDDTQLTAEGIHEYFGTLDVRRFPQAKTPTKFRARLKSSIRAHQKQRRRGS